MTSLRRPEEDRVSSDSIEKTGNEEVHLLPDTHAHLDADDFSDDFEAVMARASAVGVDRILAVGEDFATSRKAVGLAARYDMIFAAVGIHPHRANQFHEERREVERLLNEEKVVAVGEVGLDWLRGSVARDTQSTAFREQLHWAAERDLPVSVHNRGADPEILDALQDVSVTAVLHCFDGPWDLASRALAANHFVSFAGNLTFKRYDELREVAKRVPANRLLVETDSPALSPQRWRGKRNEPAQIIETATMLASLRGISLLALSAQVSKNANDVFRWSCL
jgi:TatD DNase family protein